jgi:hypothetical protein
MADLERDKGIDSPAGNREISGGPGGQARAGSALTWPEAKDAVREAFERARESHTTS